MMTQRSPSIRLGSLRSKKNSHSKKNFTLKNQLKVCESLGLLPIRKNSQNKSQNSRMISPSNSQYLKKYQIKTNYLTKCQSNQIIKKKNSMKKQSKLKSKKSIPRFLSCNRALSTNTSNFQKKYLKNESSIPKSDFRRNFSNFKISEKKQKNMKLSSKRALTIGAKSKKKFQPSNCIPNLMMRINLSKNIKSPKNLSKNSYLTKKRNPSNILKKNRATSFNSMNLNPSNLKNIETLPGTDCYNDRGGSSLGMSVFKDSIIKRKKYSNQMIFNNYINSKKSFTKVNKNFKSKPILKELVAQLKGNDNLQLEILKSLGCFKNKKTKKSSNTISGVNNPKNIEALKKLNKLILKDKKQVSKIKNELDKSSKKKAMKKKNPEIFFESNLNSIPLSNIYPRTNKQSNISKVPQALEPFSLQNNKICFPINQINSNNEYLKHMYQLNMKENNNQSIRTSNKKSKKKVNVLSSTFSKSKTASNFKNVKSLKNSVKSRKKSFSKKKKELRDEDIKHHMNLIFINDLNIGKKRHSKNFYVK